MTPKQRRIEQLKNRYKMQKTQKETYQVTPEIYASFAIALHNRGWDYDKIDNLFEETQQIWVDYVNNGTSDRMADDCLKMTGIDVRTGK